MLIVALYFFGLFRNDHKEFNNQTKKKKQKQNAENVCTKNVPNDDRSSVRNNLFKTRFYADLSGMLFFFLFKGSRLCILFNLFGFPL